LSKSNTTLTPLTKLFLSPEKDFVEAQVSSTKAERKSPRSEPLPLMKACQ